jgi:hypothetical protein
MLQQQDLPEGVGVQQAAPDSTTAILANGSAGLAQAA